MHWWTLFLYGWVIFHWLDLLNFVHLFISWWTGQSCCGMFHMLADCFLLLLFNLGVFILFFLKPWEKLTFLKTCLSDFNVWKNYPTYLLKVQNSRPISRESDAVWWEGPGNCIFLTHQLIVMQVFPEYALRSSTAAAAAKSLQSCPTLCDPIDGSPPGPSVHGIFQARVLEWVAIAFFSTQPGGG